MQNKGLLYDNFIEQMGSLKKLIELVSKIGINVINNSEFKQINYSIKHSICLTLMKHLAINDSGDQKANFILDNIKLINQEEIIIANYIDVLRMIFKQYANMNVNADTVFQLHTRLISFTDENIGWRVPSSGKYANDVSKSVAVLCKEYGAKQNLQDNRSSIVDIANFILQIILLKPFNNKNELIICLLLRLILYKNGYIKLGNSNIEEIILNSQNKLLDIVSDITNNDQADCIPWLEYFTSIIVAGLENSVEVVSDSDDIVFKKIIDSLGSEFTNYDIERYYPYSNVNVIRKILDKMSLSGEVVCVKDGIKLTWHKINKLPNRNVISSKRGDKTRIVLNAIHLMNNNFCFADVYDVCANVSSITIRKILEAEKKQGRIVCRRKGRSSSWQKVEN